PATAFASRNGVFSSMRTSLARSARLVSFYKGTLNNKCYDSADVRSSAFTRPSIVRLQESRPRGSRRKGGTTNKSPHSVNLGVAMSKLEKLREEIVTANRILAHEGVVDSFGHVSARNPENPKTFLLSRARAPERIEVDDIMEFTLEGDPINARGRAPYLERFIHGGIYEARPDINGVVHNHSPSVIPFGITERKLRPLLHMCANIGHA